MVSFAFKTSFLLELENDLTVWSLMEDRNSHIIDDHLSLDVNFVTNNWYNRIYSLASANKWIEIEFVQGVRKFYLNFSSRFRYGSTMGPKIKFKSDPTRLGSVRAGPKHESLYFEIFCVVEQFSDQLSYLQSCDNFRVTFSCHLSELIHLQDVTKCQFISNM